MQPQGLDQYKDPNQFENFQRQNNDRIICFCGIFGSYISMNGSMGDTS